MRAAVVLNGDATAAGGYVGWTASPATVRLTDPGGAVAPVDVVLRNEQAGVGGQVAFYAAAAGGPADSLALQLPLDGSPVPFFVGGRFGAPSVADRDAAIEVASADGATSMGATRLMVRVRKDANLLTPAERDRFIGTLATLNDRGAGRFREIREMHASIVWEEAHGRAGFLPWHRAYLLDLERELQAIDASVALPYWKFDAAAPNLFAPSFLGTSDANGTVLFAADNPLQFWSTDQGTGISRRTAYDFAQRAARTRAGEDVLTEDATLALGDVLLRFTDLEGNPHATAHVACGGFLSDSHNAPRDPLFFLLHCNVDRLWAKWQWLRGRYDLENTATYPYLGQAGDADAERVGHNAHDTMWPWNLDVQLPRPPTAPGGEIASSPLTSAPARSPRVREMIDYQGIRHPASRLGFDYEDVPYERLGGVGA